MRLIAAVALVAALSAGTAHGQPAPWQPERFTAGWVFTPSLVFGGMWDSNVTVRHTNSPEVEEWVGLVNPRGEIDFNGRRGKFNAGYSGTLHAYRTLGELNRYDQRARASGRRQLTPRLSVETRHSASSSPTTEDLDINGLPFTQVGADMYTGRGGVAYALNDRTSVAADYGFEWVRFDRDTPEFSLLRGGISHSLGSTVMRRVAARLSAGGSASYAHTRLGGGEVVSDLYRSQGEVAWQLGPNTSISGGAGIAYLQLQTADETQVGPTYGAGIAHEAGRVQLRGRVEKTFVPTYGFGTTVAHSMISGSVFVPLARGRMFLNAGTSYRKADPIEGLGNLIQIDSLRVEGTFGLHTTRWLRMEAFYTGSFQESSARGKYDRTRIGVQFVTSKPVRVH
jgi:hypothetical protein